jgi:hypothetical protein
MQQAKNLHTVLEFLNNLWETEATFLTAVSPVQAGRRDRRQEGRLRLRHGGEDPRLSELSYISELCSTYAAAPQ